MARAPTAALAMQELCEPRGYVSMRDKLYRESCVQHMKTRREKRRRPAQRLAGHPVSP